MMNKPGRNDPCPCGSGKKYKKCCLNKPMTNIPFQQEIEPQTQKKQNENRDPIELLYEKGEELLAQGEYIQACNVWEDAWIGLKKRLKPEFIKISDISVVFSRDELFFNCFQEFEAELGNAGLSEPAYYKKRIKYCQEFCDQFYEEDSIIPNMVRAVAESHFALGNAEEGERCFKGLINEYPLDIWGYIGWGDMYTSPMKRGVEPDFKKAAECYNLAMGMHLENENILLDRLKDIESELN